MRASSHISKWEMPAVCRRCCQGRRLALSSGREDVRCLYRVAASCPDGDGMG